MKKYLLGIVVAVALVLPANFVSAQSSEEQYRTLLIQLIISLQKQIATLSSVSLAPISNANDRCPNIDGVQSNIPTGLIYSRTFDKCVTERELDELENESSRNERVSRVCEQTKDNLSEARRSFLSQVDLVDSLKTKVKKHGGPSKYTLAEVERMMKGLQLDQSEKLWSDEDRYLIGVIGGIKNAQNERDNLQREVVKIESELDKYCD